MRGNYDLYASLKLLNTSLCFELDVYLELLICGRSFFPQPILFLSFPSAVISVVDFSRLARLFIVFCAFSFSSIKVREMIIIQHA